MQSLSAGSQSGKATYYRTSTIEHPGKCKTMEKIKGSVAVGVGGRERQTGTAPGIFRVVKLLRMTL